MLLLISLLLLQNIWSVTAPYSYARDKKCTYKQNKYPAPLVFDNEYKLLPSYFVASQDDEIRLACPGKGNDFKRIDETMKSVQVFEFRCHLGDWNVGNPEFDNDPNKYACTRHAGGSFQRTDKCDERSSRFSFVVKVSQKEIKLFNVCRTNEDPRTIASFHVLSSFHLPTDQLPEGASVPGRTFPIQAYSGFTGDPTEFKRYQQTAMEKEYNKEIVKPYFGYPKMDLYLTPTWVVPFEDFPHLDGLQAEHNSFLLYAPVLQHLQIIYEAIRQLSNKRQMKISVLTLISSENEMFMKVKLFTPNNVKMLVNGNDACIAFEVSNRLDLATLIPEYRCKSLCSAQGWPDLLDPTKGYVQCCSPEEVGFLDGTTPFKCDKGSVLQGPLELPESRT